MRHATVIAHGAGQACNGRFGVGWRARATDGRRPAGALIIGVGKRSFACSVTSRDGGHQGRLGRPGPIGSPSMPDRSTGGET